MRKLYITALIAVSAVIAHGQSNRTDTVKHNWNEIQFGDPSGTVSNLGDVKPDSSNWIQSSPHSDRVDKEYGLSPLSNYGWTVRYKISENKININVIPTKNGIEINMQTDGGFITLCHNAKMLDTTYKIVDGIPWQILNWEYKIKQNNCFKISITMAYKKISRFMSAFCDYKGISIEPYTEQSK